MEIQRIHDYFDPRFSPAVLRQHGAFLADGRPCEVEILGPCEAVVRAAAQDREAVIAAFRFYAEHITRFVDEQGRLLRAFPPVETFWVDTLAVQPSQFFVDREKLAAVATFVQGPEQVVLPLCRLDGRLVACDGHTRLKLAWQRGYPQALGFWSSDPGGYLAHFVQEARRRSISSVADMSVLTHEAYREQWHGFCDGFFAARNTAEADDAPSAST